MSYGGQCIKCGERVDAQHAAYPVTGWEVARDGGGANQIKHRRRVPNQIAHLDCMDALERQRDRNGVQATLLP